MKSTIYIIAIILFPISLLSQKANIDSLVEHLPKELNKKRLQAASDILTLTQTTRKDVAQQMIDEQYKIVKHLNNDTLLARVYNAHGIFHYYQTNIDSCVFYFEKALEGFEKVGDKKRVGYGSNNIGIILEQQGDYKGAMTSYIRAIKIFEEVGERHAEATAIQNVGRNWSSLGDNENSLIHYKKALEIFNTLENEEEIIDGKILIGAALSLLSRYKESNQLNFEAYEFYKANQNNYGTMIAQNNIGINYHKMMSYDSAIFYFTSVLEQVEQFEEPNILASAKRDLGNSYIEKGNLKKGIPLLQESLDYFKSEGIYEELIDGYLYLSQGNEKANKYKAALNQYKMYEHLKDSIASKKLIAEIADLESKYETEKKETRIILLEKEAQLESTKKKALWGGLGLTILAALMSLFGIVQRNKKKQAILYQEKAIALEKQQQAEQQLEFKKKELLAKVLQLSKKNEFLHTLEQEVGQLKSTLGSSVSKSTDRINRMITNDAIDEEEWDQFSKEFSSVHEDFIQAITKRYGIFTQSELRLVSLLKMNLSSKEIANILRISDEGIKKARYRLRKKMNLVKGEDLQGIILAL